MFTMDKQDLALLSGYQIAVGNQKFPVWVQLLVIWKGGLAPVVTWLMSKCLWSGRKLQTGVKEITPTSPAVLWIVNVRDKKNR